MTAAATATATEANTTGTSTRLSESPSLLASSRATSAASSWLHELAVSFVRALFRQFVFFSEPQHTHTHIGSLACSLARRTQLLSSHRSVQAALSLHSLSISVAFALASLCVA